MLTISKILISAAVCATLGSIPIMAGNGSTPKGKPFVQINDQIIEVTGAVTSLEDQVDLLVARVDTLEDRAGALETAVADIEANNAVLSAMISQNATDITSIKQAISDLEADNVALQSQVDGNSGDIQDVQDQIAANDALIAALGNAIIDLESGSVAADADLQILVDNNLALIAEMQGEIDAINEMLELKQNIIAGTCPNGQAVIAVTEDSISCGQVGGSGSGSGTYSTYYRYNTSVYLAPRGSGQVDARCNDGDILTGGGYSNGLPFIEIRQSRPDFALINGEYVNVWRLSGKNVSNQSVHLWPVAQCLHVN